MVAICSCKSAASQPGRPQSAFLLLTCFSSDVPVCMWSRWQRHWRWTCCWFQFTVPDIGSLVLLSGFCLYLYPSIKLSPFLHSCCHVVATRNCSVFTVCFRTHVSHFSLYFSSTGLVQFLGITYSTSLFSFWFRFPGLYFTCERFSPPIVYSLRISGCDSILPPSSIQDTSRDQYFPIPSSLLTGTDIMYFRLFLLFFLIHCTRIAPTLTFCSFCR